MKYLALLLLFTPACKLGPIKTYPSVGYGLATDGSGSEQVMGSLTFDYQPDPPPARPVLEVAGPPRSFPDPERLDPDSAPTLATPLPVLPGSGHWRWIPAGSAAAGTEGGPEGGGEEPEAPGSAQVTTENGIETPWGSMSLAALTAILGTLATIWGIKRTRAGKADA